MLNVIAGSVGRLEDSVERGFREIRETLASDYVPRREIDRRFDDVCIDVAALQGRMRAAEDKAAGEVRDRQARLEQAERDRLAAEQQAERDRRSTRFQRIALASSSAVALLGTAAGVVLHFA